MRKYKPRNDNIDMENIELNKWYSITINPEKQFEKDGYLRYTSVLKHVQRVLNEYTSNIEYYLKMEVSKLGRVHFHGWVKYRKDISMIYICLIPKLISIATISIDYIDDPDIWHDYVTKQCKCFDHTSEINYPPNLMIKDIMVSSFASSPKKEETQSKSEEDNEELSEESSGSDVSFYDSEGEKLEYNKKLK